MSYNIVTTPLETKSITALSASAIWGNISGNISNQTDLQTVLDSKQVTGNYVKTVNYQTPDASGNINVTTGFNSPIVSAGDLIIGNESGSAVRLPIGNDKQVLTVSAGNIGWADAVSGGGSSGTGVSKTITAANSFSVGQAVYFNGSNYVLAKANTASTLGLWIISAASPTSFDIQQAGYISGLSGLIAGQYYFVSDTIAGDLTITEPTTYSNPILFAISTTEGWVLPFRPSSAVSGSVGASGTTASGFTAINFNLASDYNFVNTSLSGGNLILSNGTTGVQQTPTMTSNTAPSGIASASSVYTVGTYDAYKAFDGVIGAVGNIWGMAAENIVGWLAYEFVNSTIINSYKLSSRETTYANQTPKTWTFEGWNGSSWIILDTRSNETGWSGYETRTYYFNNNTPYIKYRVNITANNGGSISAIAELKLIKLSYISNGYSSTTNDSHLDLTYISAINGLTFNTNIPANTDIKTLVSFDGRNTWKTYKNSTWTSVPLSAVSVSGMSIGEVTNALVSYQIVPGVDKYVDFGFGLSTIDDLVTPSIDSVIILYSIVN